MATKLSDILNQESSGIMFPFKTAVKSVKTEQQVYTPTDGIMNVTGRAYQGPDATITYGSEEQGYPRQLKEIEKGMLPQFDQTQFADKGEGKIETSTPAVLPVTTETKAEPDKPIMDPCPVGFKLDPIKKICVPIEKTKSDRQTGPTNPPRNIGPIANSIEQVSKAFNKLKDTGGIYADGFKDLVTLEIDNSSILSNFGFLGKFIDEAFIKGPADKNFLKTFGSKDSPLDPEDLKGITVTKVKDGKLKVSFDQKGKENYDKIMTDESLKGNLASTQKTDNNGNIILAPNGQPMIVGPITTGSFGTTSGKGFKSAPSYKIKDGKVIPDKPKNKVNTKTFASKRKSMMRDRTKTPTANRPGR